MFLYLCVCAFVFVSVCVCLFMLVPAEVEGAERQPVENQSRVALFVCVCLFVFVCFLFCFFVCWFVFVTAEGGVEGQRDGQLRFNQDWGNEVARRVHSAITLRDLRPIQKLVIKKN